MPFLSAAVILVALAPAPLSIDVVPCLYKALHTRCWIPSYKHAIRRLSWLHGHTCCFPADVLTALTATTLAGQQHGVAEKLLQAIAAAAVSNPLIITTHQHKF